MILRLAVSVEHRLVTDVQKRTDRLDIRRQIIPPPASVGRYKALLQANNTNSRISRFPMTLSDFQCHVTPGPDLEVSTADWSAKLVPHSAKRFSGSSKQQRVNEM